MSCWKCGSGQHLVEMQRFPASASQIAGVGGIPELDLILGEKPNMELVFIDTNTVGGRQAWIMVESDQRVMQMMNAEDRPAEERMTRAEAEGLATKMINLLQPYADSIDVCGSYRRGREDPGDLDIVVILKPRVTLPEVVENLEGEYTAVNWAGEKKTQMVIDGVKVDIRTTTPRAKGAALLYFTGPAGYNIGIRRSAKSRGMKLNEYGIFDRETNEYLGGSTEEEIYEILGKNFRPATERKAENVSFAMEGDTDDLATIRQVAETILQPDGYQDLVIKNVQIRHRGDGRGGLLNDGKVQYRVAYTYTEDFALGDVIENDIPYQYQFGTEYSPGSNRRPKTAFLYLMRDIDNSEISERVEREREDRANMEIANNILNEGINQFIRVFDVIPRLGRNTSPRLDTVLGRLPDGKLWNHQKTNQRLGVGYTKSFDIPVSDIPRLGIQTEEHEDNYIAHYEDDKSKRLIEQINENVTALFGIPFSISVGYDENRDYPAKWGIYFRTHFKD